ncbi:MAG: urea transporter [Caldilineaceae bacterium]
MASIAESWDQQADSNAIVRFIDINLRGAGQVMFQNNPLTGLLFLAGIFWGAYAAGMIQVGVGALVALVVATLMAMAMDVDRQSLRIGLYGFNGILVGAALPTFLTPTPMLWVYIVIGAMVSVIAMSAIATVFKTWNVPALTFPFVLTTWFLVLGAYAFPGIQIASMGPPALPEATAAASAPFLDPTFLINGLLNGIAQVFLIQNIVTGVIFIIALAVSSWRAALFAVFGAAVALITILVLGGEPGSISAGLFGFSAVLTAIALGATFYPFSPRTVFVTLIATIFTVIVQGALDTALAPLGIPTFTAPFVFVTWLFLLPHLNLAPAPHEQLPVPAKGALAAPGTGDGKGPSPAVMPAGAGIRANANK